MIRAYGECRKGLVRKLNEDYIYVSNNPYFILADGMGGYKGGQIASRIAVESAKDFFKETPQVSVSEEVMKKSILYANKIILEQKKDYPNLNQMGSTLITVALNKDKIYWAHVGDSRIYYFKNGILKQITEDHSFVMNLLKKGKITIDEAKKHPRRNEITRAVGINEDLDVDTGEIRLEKNSVILICSDGLTGMLEDYTINKVLSEYKFNTDENLKNCAEKLMELVYDAGANDNISLILISYEND